MDFSPLTPFLDSLEEMGIPGCDLAVNLGGKQVYRHQAGFSDREKGKKMQGNELFYMYSMSKVVTCAAALTLFEKGKFLMDEPVSDFIPEFRHMMVRRIKPSGEAELVPAESQITFLHLFSMTSGIDESLDEENLVKAVKASGGKAPTVEMAKAIAKRPLNFQPGTQFLYGLSLDVMAALVEVISGEKFGDYVKRVIFDPCRMADSSYLFPHDKTDRFARLYSFDEKTHVLTPTDNVNIFMLGSEYESGGAGLVSSVDDYMRFARMMTRKGLTEDGHRILATRTVDLMRTDTLAPRGITSFDWEHFRGYGYGLGVRTMVDKALAGSPSPIGEFGWAGWAGAYVLLDPENDLSAVYAQHVIPSREPYIHRRLRNIIYSCLD